MAKRSIELSSAKSWLTNRGSTVFSWSGILLGFVLIAISSPSAIARLSPVGNVTFGNANALSTTATFDSTGTWVLQLSVSDGSKIQLSTMTVTVNAPLVMPKLSISSGAAIAGNSVDISINLSSGTMGVSAMNFDLNFSSGVSVSTAAAGSSAIAAGKGIQAAMVGSDFRVLIFGLNQATMASGSVAVITLRLDPNLPTGTLPLKLLNVAASDPNGTDIVMAASVPGSISVTANKAPIITIGPNQTITLPASANLTATATDDGAPNPPGALTPLWSPL